MGHCVGLGGPLYLLIVVSEFSIWLDPSKSCPYLQKGMVLLESPSTI